MFELISILGRQTQQFANHGQRKRSREVRHSIDRVTTLAQSAFEFIEDVIGHEPLGTEFGDNVAVGIGEHDIDTSGFRRGQDAGAVTATGEGGELVWSQTLTPEERKVLKKYFK